MADPNERKKDAMDNLFDSLDNDAPYTDTRLDDDDEENEEALLERQVRDISLTQEEDDQASLLALEAELAREQQGSETHHGFNRATITNSRVYPLGAIVPLKLNNNKWNDPWLKRRHDRTWQHAQLVVETPRWAPGSITCIVQKAGDPNRYILTVGHAFYDIDQGRKDKAQANQLDYSWGEPDLLELARLDPYAKSEGKYYRMGDKFGSKVDCGLAKLNVRDKTGARLRWSNYYVIDAHKRKRLVALDTWPPPAQGIQLLFHWWEKRMEEFIVCSYVECTFTNYEGKHVSELERVLIRPRDFVSIGSRKEYHYNGSPVQSGASGSAIIREVPGTDGAYVVGLALGFCTITQAKDLKGMFIALDPNIIYDIFQHVSVAQDKLGLAQDLPQPEQ